MKQTARKGLAFTGIIYYFSGLKMKNMMAVPDIVNAPLDEALKKN